MDPKRLGIAAHHIFLGLIEIEVSSNYNVVILVYSDLSTLSSLGKGSRYGGPPMSAIFALPQIPC